MKKDIEWLKETLEEIIDTMAKFEDISYSIGLKEAYQHTLLLINQLDEPKVLSQEWIDEKSFPIIHQAREKDVVPVKDLQNLLVPKQPFGNSEELPVIPKFVAEWIEAERGTTSNWKLPSRFISDTKNKKDQRRYKWSQVEGNMDKFMSALINGYEVEEEEQKYNVKFKVKSSLGTVGIFLYKEGDEVLAGDNFKAYYPKEEKYRLTEKEIRSFQNGDVLFEHFAVKVEELEE